MKISYHGHSVVYFESKGQRAIIDPFISGNELCDLNVNDVEVDFILLTHGHNDHVGDTVAIAKKNNARVIAPFELAEFIGNHGVDAHPMSIGGSHDFDFGRITFVQAFHSSSFTDDEGTVHYAGMPTGIIVDSGEKKFYHMGDTGVFSDLKLISDLNGPFDLTFVPIGDNFTMGVEHASYAINTFINTKGVVPIHYNTFSQIEADPEAFREAVNVNCQILKPGDTYTW